VSAEQPPSILDGTHTVPGVAYGLSGDIPVADLTPAVRITLRVEARSWAVRAATAWHAAGRNPQDRGVLDTAEQFEAWILRVEES
jgi:hypothetical protein